jgi:hypothetical protein
VFRGAQNGSVDELRLADVAAHVPARKMITRGAVWAIGNLPGIERMHLMRYQGPEQRSREGASANGRVQHGAGSHSVLPPTVHLL